MRRDPIRVGTRGSLLARAQTQWVLDRLRERRPDLRFEVVIVRTAGDEGTRRGPAPPAGRGLFTREIETALRDGTVDLAVHSLKDLPTENAADLALGAVPERADPADALTGCTLEALRRAPPLYRLGTGSLRRKAQLLRAFPGCRVADLRGNLDTRLRKVREGVVDGAVVALAGLLRLGRADAASARLPYEVMLPAPGQGALALQIRADDADLQALAASVHCPVSGWCAAAERAFLGGLGGGCQVPVGALAVVCDGILRLTGRVLSPDGHTCIEGCREGPPAEAEAVGRALADDLRARGAGDILDRPQGAAGKDTSDE